MRSERSTYAIQNAWREKPAAELLKLVPHHKETRNNGAKPHPRNKISPTDCFTHHKETRNV